MRAKAKDLTPAQFEVLRALAVPGEYAHYMPYLGRFNPRPRWHSHITLRNLRITAMEKLIDLGYVERKGYHPHAQGYITDKGRDYIKARRNGDTA